MLAISNAAFACASIRDALLSDVRIIDQQRDHHAEHEHHDRIDFSADHARP
jgi:hypothetical protein